MENPASPEDLTVRGYSAPSGSQVGQTRLDEAWRALQTEVPCLVDRIRSRVLDVDAVIDVIAAGALRVLRNPEGYSKEAGSLDDYSESHELADSTQDLYFTRAELRRLFPPGYGATANAGSFKYS